MSEKRYFPLHPGSTSSSVLKIMSTNPLQLWRLKDLFAGVKSKKVSDVHAVSDALTTLIRRGLVVRKKRGVYKLMDLDWNQPRTETQDVVKANPKVSKPEVTKEIKKSAKREGEMCSRCGDVLFSTSEIHVGICGECQSDLEEEEVVDGEEEVRDVYMDELVQEISSARAKFRSRTGKALDKIVFVRENSRNVRLLITYTKDEIIEL